jgi:hypothetical protein
VVRTGDDPIPSSSTGLLLALMVPYHTVGTALPRRQRKADTRGSLLPILVGLITHARIVHTFFLARIARRSSCSRREGASSPFHIYYYPYRLVNRLVTPLGVIVGAVCMYHQYTLHLLQPTLAFTLLLCTQHLCSATVC